MLTATFGLFECPICIDLYLVPYWRTPLTRFRSPLLSSETECIGSYMPRLSSTLIPHFRLCAA